VTVDADRRIALWDVETGLLVRLLSDGTLEHLGGSINSVKYFPDSARVITGDGDGLMIVWDVTTGGALLRFLPAANKDALGHEGATTDLAVHPSGNYVFSASVDGTLVLWDAITGTPLEVYEGHNN